MRAFRNASIQRKQMLVIMLTSTVALLLACDGFVIYEIAAFRGQLTVKLTTLEPGTAFLAKPYTFAALAQNVREVPDSEPDRRDPTAGLN